MKQVISDAKLGEFILGCMRVTAAAHKLAYEIEETLDNDTLDHDARPTHHDDIFRDLEQDQKVA